MSPTPVDPSKDKKAPSDFMEKMKAKAKEMKPATQEAPAPPTGPAPLPLSKEAESVAKNEIILKRSVLIRAPLPKRHTVTVTRLGARDQVYPFLTECSCGFQARSYTDDNASLAADQHLSINAPGGVEEAEELKEAETAPPAPTKPESVVSR